MSTLAYVDLMFAWGHARLGDADTARRLVDSARDLLDTRQTPGNPHPRDNLVRAWLLDAFVYRVAEAIDDRTHGGPWPDALADRLRSPGRTFEGRAQGYAIDRLRNLSRILEPVERIDPYLPWKTGDWRPLQPLHDLLAAGRADEIAPRFLEQAQKAAESGDPLEASYFYDEALRTREQLATRLGDDILDRAESFATGLLRRRWSDHPGVGTWFTQHRPLPGPDAGAEERRQYETDRADPGRWVENRVYGWATGVFESALSFAEAADREDQVGRLVDWYVGLYTGESVPVPARQQFGRAVGPVSRALIRLNRRGQAGVVRDRLSPERIAADLDGGEHEPMIACLGLAALNYWLGRREPAEWVWDQTRIRLPHMATPVTQVRAICDYADAAALTDWSDTVEHVRRLTAAMPRVPNTYTTARDYSRLHLEVTEHLVRAVTTANPAPPAKVLRAMSADEIASRREALAGLRAKLVEWGQADWSH